MSSLSYSSTHSLRRGEAQKEVQVPACKSWEHGDTCMKHNRTESGFSQDKAFHDGVQASGKGGLQSPCPLGKGRSIYTSSLLPGPSSCIPVELKPVQLVCAGKCKSRADKGVPSFHRLRVARSPAAACLLLAPGRGGGEENPKMETKIHHYL